jgi:hypothetical protein
MDFMKKAKANVAGAVARSGGLGQVFTTVEPAASQGHNLRGGSMDSWVESKSQHEIRFMVSPPGSSRIYTGSTNIRVWSIITGEVTHVVHIKKTLASVSCLATSSGLVVSGHTDGSVVMVDASSQQCVQQQQPHRSKITALAVDSRRQLWTGSDRGMVRVWDADERMLAEFEMQPPKGNQHGREVRALLHVPNAANAASPGTVWAGGHSGAHVYSGDQLNLRRKLPDSKSLNCLACCTLQPHPEVTGHIDEPAAADVRDDGGGSWLARRRTAGGVPVAVVVSGHSTGRVSAWLAVEAEEWHARCIFGPGRLAKSGRRGAAPAVTQV